MIKSIQQFQTNGVKNLEKIFMDYSSNMTKIAEMVYGVKNTVIQLGLNLIVEELETYDEYLRKHKNACIGWQIVRRDTTTLLTSLGNITYRKTLFKNKETGKSEYLLDRVMGIEKEAPESKRHKLVNPYYFCRGCEGEANQQFWDEIYAYIENHYDLEKVKRIYLNADGGAWIKAGKNRIEGITYVLDEFHLENILRNLQVI